MPLFRREFIKIVAGEDFDLLARVVRRVNGENVLPADDGSDYDSVEFRIFTRTSRNAIYTVTGIAPGTVIDALEFDDPEWTKPGGYNFRYEVLASALLARDVTLQANNTYIMQVTLLEASVGPRYVVWVADVVSPAA